MTAFENLDWSLRDKIEQLQNATHVWWSEWEQQFIESICEKLDDKVIDVSPAQLDKINELVDRT